MGRINSEELEQLVDGCDKLQDVFEKAKGLVYQLEHIPYSGEALQLVLPKSDYLVVGDTGRDCLDGSFHGVSLLPHGGSTRYHFKKED